MDDETSNIKQAQPKQGLETGGGLGRDPNSNIKQAQPKQGLETGGLISGKERIAREYAPALSGAKGPVAQFDAVDEIAGLRAQQAIDGLTFSSPAGSPAVFGRNGYFSIANSQFRKTAKDPVVKQEPTHIPFDVIRAPIQGEDGPTMFTLHLPYVRKSNKYDVEELSVPITIDDFEVEAGSWLVAKMLGPIATFIETPEITIEVITEDAWTSFPNAHKANASAPYAWTESRIPLWQFLSEEDKTDTSVLLLSEDDEKIYGQKFIGTSPQLVYTLAAIEAGDTDRLRTVPELL